MNNDNRRPQDDRPSVRNQNAQRMGQGDSPADDRGERQVHARSARQANDQDVREAAAQYDRRTYARASRQAGVQPSGQRAAAYRPVTYRKAREDAAHKRLMRAVYGAAAAVVVVAVAFGVMAFMHNGSDVKTQPSSDSLVQSAVTDVQGTGTEATGGSSSAAADGDAQLAARAENFAVDPNKTDWNFSTNGKKTVYLTIDDGPSPMTPQVLDILDRYGCKATFFVVGHNDDCFPYIAEAFKRGHTIGLHSMTHDYAYVYSSVDAYYQDLEDIGQVVKDQIGFVPCFIRFPGGSSNEVSASYTSGIMTSLTQSVQERGYQYYDWNLSVGDGSEHTADEIAEYGMADDGNENIMLLCHDSATKQSTVDALPRIIEHYQSLGYTFEAIDRSSWVCHHGVNN